MTGADPAAFAGIGATGEVFDVDSGRITRRPD
jgi:DNA replication and repair protein RecF